MATNIGLNRENAILDQLWRFYIPDEGLSIWRFTSKLFRFRFRFSVLKIIYQHSQIPFFFNILCVLLLLIIHLNIFLVFACALC